MPYFGDINLPWLVSKDTSISKDFVEKNFVDQPSQVYELTPDLEAGTYSAILNETVHDKGESFEEQQDAVLSMVSRHGTEFPFNVAGDDGYIIVSGATTVTDPRQEIRDAELDVRFLDTDDYNGAVIVNPFSYRGGAFDSQAEPHESLVGFPSSINVVGKTSDYTVTGQEGDIDYYIISDREVVEYEETDLNSQQESICRLFNSSDERVYSDSRVVDNGSTVDNSLIRVTYNSSNSQVEYYDGGWVTIGTAGLSFNNAYTSINENDEIEIAFINENTSSVYRGFSIVKYSFSDQTEFTFNSDTSVTSITEEDYYAHWEDGNGRDIVVVKTFNGGDFYTDSSDLGVENLLSSDEYDLFFGIVPSSISVSDFARYVYNIGSRKRTFVQ